MDPAACVGRILSALAADDNDEALSACADLREWIAHGGFRPYGWSPECCAAFITACWKMAEACGGALAP